MNISRYSHNFPCQSQHVLIRKYVSSKWPCSNRKSYNWINKSKQQTRLVPSVTPCTSKKHPLANCPCIFVRTTVIRSRFVISCGLHSPAARWVWTSSGHAFRSGEGIHGFMDYRPWRGLTNGATTETYRTKESYHHSIAKGYSRGIQWMIVFIFILHCLSSRTMPYCKSIHCFGGCPFLLNHHCQCWERITGLHTAHKWFIVI